MSSKEDTWPLETPRPVDPPNPFRKLLTLHLQYRAPKDHMNMRIPHLGSEAQEGGSLEIIIFRILVFPSPSAPLIVVTPPGFRKEGFCMHRTVEGW